MFIVQRSIIIFTASIENYESSHIELQTRYYNNVKTYISYFLYSNIYKDNFSSLYHVMSWIIWYFLTTCTKVTAKNIIYSFSNLNVQVTHRRLVDKSQLFSMTWHSNGLENLLFFKVGLAFCSKKYELWGRRRSSFVLVLESVEFSPIAKRSKYTEY